MSETSNNNYDNKNEIDFFELLFTIFKGKLIIFIITSLFALVGFMYLSNLPVKPYQASVSFISPSASSIAELTTQRFETKYSESNKEFSNITSFAKVSPNELMDEFLAKLRTKKNQIDIFIDGEYINQFNNVDEPISSEFNYALSILSSFSLLTPKQDNSVYELPYIISLKGSNPAAIKGFLVELVNQNAKDALNEIKNTKIDEINRELESLIFNRKSEVAETKASRLSEISRMQEQDYAAIQSLNREIEIEKNLINLRFKYEVMLLSEDAALAKTLGITENNFKQFTNLDISKFSNVMPESILKGSGSDSAIRDSKNLPEWYMFGEKALLKKIELINERIKNEPLNLNLIDLNAELVKRTNNINLVTLMNRKDDEAYSDNINNLDTRISVLESDLKKISMLQPTSLIRILDDTLIIDMNENITYKVMILSIFLGLFFSILIVLIKDAFIKRTS